MNLTPTFADDEALQPLGSSPRNRWSVSQTRADLRNLGITTLMFAGVNADQCVLCTLQDANFRGYDCLLLEECAATTSPHYCMAATIYDVRQCFGFVIRSESLRAELTAGPSTEPAAGGA
jgi:nicotinamidase-related amidase